MLEQGRQQTEHGFGYPRYVEQTFRRYLACGIPSEGLARIKCDGCGSEHVAAFSCKQRAVCPSCQARRMADLSAQLVDGLLPEAPYRQYVFTFPVPLRLAIIRDNAVPSDEDVAHLVHTVSRRVDRWIAAHLTDDDDVAHDDDEHQ